MNGDPNLIIILIPLMLFAGAGFFGMLLAIMANNGGGSVKFMSHEQSVVLEKLVRIAYNDTRLVDRALNECAQYHREYTKMDKLFNKGPSRLSKYPYAKLDEVIEYIKQHTGD